MVLLPPVRPRVAGVHSRRAGGGVELEFFFRRLLGRSGSCDCPWHDVLCNGGAGGCLAGCCPRKPSARGTSLLLELWALFVLTSVTRPPAQHLLSCGRLSLYS